MRTLIAGVVLLLCAGCALHFQAPTDPSWAFTVDETKTAREIDADWPRNGRDGAELAASGPIGSPTAN